MLHHMKLHPIPFYQMRKGEKTIELQLYDPKRQRIKVGDQIEFSNTQEKTEKLRVKVKALYPFASFSELYHVLPLAACGYTDVTKADPNDMNQFYSVDEQQKYGVVGIEVELVDWNDPLLEKTSRYISFLLRHHPDAAGLTLDEHGWASTAALIECVGKTRHITMAMLEQIVSTDKKQRYAFNTDKTLIRANQGHSIPVDVELTPCVPPQTLWHGTATKYIDSIDQNGLLSQTRLYVHLSADYQTAVTVGRRHGEPIVYIVDSAKMHADGYIFYKSVNNVWLTKSVPAIYLQKEN